MCHRAWFLKGGLKECVGHRIFQSSQSKRFWLVETLVANNAVLVGKDNWRNVSPHEAIHLNAMTAEEDFPRNHIKQESAAAGGQKC